MADVLIRLALGELGQDPYTGDYACTIYIFVNERKELLSCSSSLRATLLGDAIWSKAVSKWFGYLNAQK